ncbi:hypothetical protein CE195_10670 [Sodalis-like symbiont of Philaenus spumarius]|nr:hypothetical protein CE195_10670 [Sodalis-like symbiont of Philaenus spumarius]
MMLEPNADSWYAPITWRDCSGEFTDIFYHKSADGIAKITLHRPQVRNAFRPLTVKEMMLALSDARYDEGIGVIILTGEGEKAFCSGGDQKVRGDYGGYQDDGGAFITSTYSIFNARFAPAPNRSWRWWPAMPSAAAMSCI